MNASANDLAAYQRPRSPGRAWLWLALACITAGLLLWPGLEQYGRALGQFGPTAAQAAGRPWFGAAWLSLCAFGLLYLLWPRPGTPPALRLSQAGLSLADRRGNLHNYTWEQIEGLFFGQEAYRLFVWRTRPASLGRLQIEGRAVNLADYVAPADLPQAVDQMKELLYPALLPELQRRFASGEKLNFGALHLDRQALYIHQQRLPWNQIEQIDVQEGRMWIKPARQTRLFVAVVDIMNLELLLSLANVALDSLAPN